MKKIRVWAALATYNEEKNIYDCITSLKQFAKEIVVADGASTDRTVEIAQQLGAKVIKTTNKPMFHINKNLAINACGGDWVFLIDADERVSAELSKEILEITKSNPEEDGFWVNRRNWFLGGYLKKGGAYPDSVIRLFRKGKGQLPQISLHEQIEIKGKVGTLKSDLLHLADPMFERYLARFDRYTEETASDFEKDQVKINVINGIYYLAIKPCLIFFTLYIRHRGYKDGFRGFVWALFSGFHFFFAWAKYWSKQS